MGLGNLRIFAFRLVVGLVTFAPVVSLSDTPDKPSTARYLDTSDGLDWAGYGRTYGQQYYSPLSQISEATVGRLGLAWSMDLEPLKNSATQPIAVDGVLYFATGLSVVNAVDAANGKLLWRYDPQAAEHAGLNLRHIWGVRGIAWWQGKIYTGTPDGRLIAIDARSGRPVWSVQTFDKDDPAYISGAPRVFDGKVLIGFAGEVGITRGYVTAYDADTGKKLWRFYTVPGNRAKGFENSAMEMAAKTWAGEWWKFGGGGAVWDGITYDPETDTVYIGTAGGYPSNRRVRSRDQGDNLFVTSIIALDGKTGTYKWHYQEDPGETWDYDSVNEIQLANLSIAGKARKVLMHAPKDGFFYVIDRITGELISAQPYAKVTWASGIDLKTGRPIENPDVRYRGLSEAEIWPSGIGAHSWMPMAYSPKTRLVYIPKIEFGLRYSDRGIDLTHWQAPTDRSDQFAITFDTLPGRENPIGALIAWDPVQQKAVWSVSHPTMYNSGLLATGGNLVFQGTIDGVFKAYAAASGRDLWSFFAQAPLIATPISYTANGEQYITVLTGLGMGIAAAAGANGRAEKYGLDARSQARRVLTFKVDGKAQLPEFRNAPLPPIADPELKQDTPKAKAGQAMFQRHCSKCHGPSAIGVIQAPDLRRSGVVLSAEAFEKIVRDGGLVPSGMPAFEELTDEQLEHLRYYLRTQARALHDNATSEPANRTSRLNNRSSSSH